MDGGSYCCSSGRITFYGYNTGTADSVHNRAGMIRELRQTSSGGTQYSQYDYLGSGRLAVVDYQAPDIKLDYYQAGSGTSYAGYDRFGRIKDQFWDGYCSTADVSRIKHGYDYAGNRLWREDVIAANNYYHHDELYSYDGLHRLVDSQRGDLNAGKTSVTSKIFAEDWTLDALGNWSTFKQDDDGNGTWDLNQFRSHNAANEIATIQFTSAHVAHDAAGNMTKTPKPDNWSAHHDLTYDGWNRLVKVTDGGTTVAEFRYDGKNRRIIKYDGPASSPAATYDYYYNTQWQTLEVRKNGDVDPLEEFAWHPYYIDALAVRFYDFDVNGSQIDHYYSQDANFNVVAIANSSGTVQERYLYSAYGQTVVLGHASLGQFAADEDNSSDVGNSTLYTGRMYDPETGLLYFRNRYLNPRFGRFLVRDLISYEGGPNLFEYCDSRATGQVDPTGNVPVDGRYVCCRSKVYWSVIDNYTRFRKTILCAGGKTAEKCCEEFQATYESSLEQNELAMEQKKKEQHHKKGYKVTLVHSREGGCRNNSLVPCTNIEPGNPDQRPRPLGKEWTIKNIIGCYTGCVPCNNGVTLGCEGCQNYCHKEHLKLCEGEKNRDACKLAARHHLTAGLTLCKAGNK